MSDLDQAPAAEARLAAMEAALLRLIEWSGASQAMAAEVERLRELQRHREERLIGSCDYRGEAAEKIAALRGCAFVDAIPVVDAWERAQQPTEANDGAP